MTLIRYVQQTPQSLISPPESIIFGRSVRMQELRHNLDLIAGTDVPVLIEGESGTGKELIAQALHARSHQRSGRFLKITCPAIPQNQIEAELFGQEAGTLDGAESFKRGRIEQAEGGTLLLDEIEALDLPTQSRMMQVLQDGSFVRVGGRERRHVQTRIVSIANSDLRQRVARGEFRADLLYRINVVTLSVPPLRSRLEDLPDLLAFLLHRHSEAMQQPAKQPSSALVRLMQAYSWPGNIRQLDNIVRRLILTGDEDWAMRELAPQVQAPADHLSTPLDLSKPVSLKDITRGATHDLERQIILKVLEANGWNRQRTAKWLQISYRSLLYKLSGMGKPEDHSPEVDVRQAERQVSFSRIQAPMRVSKRA